MKRTLRVIVRGKVQGVYFRVSAKEKAISLGLTGTVRNLTDGSVELCIEGRTRTVDSMIEWCHQGPELAQVEAVEVESIPSMNLDNFTILH